jgi:hypothetical protein
MTGALTERAQVRERIEALQAHIESKVSSGELTSPLEGTEDECEHVFHDGMYARGLLIPAGTAVIGRLHKQARICIIAQGSCVFQDETQHKEVSAPWFGPFEPGSKTAVYAFTDTYWIAVLRTELEDSKTAFDTLTCATLEEYQAYTRQLEKMS